MDGWFKFQCNGCLALLQDGTIHRNLNWSFNGTRRPVSTPVYRTGNQSFPVTLVYGSNADVDVSISNSLTIQYPAYGLEWRT